MHIGEKIRFIRDLKSIKQDHMAALLEIKQPSWCAEETSGKIPEKHWPKIEQLLNVKKESIEAAENESDLIALFAGHDRDRQVIFNYNVSVVVDGADSDVVSHIRQLFEQMVRFQSGQVR